MDELRKLLDDAFKARNVNNPTKNSGVIPSSNSTYDRKAVSKIRKTEIKNKQGEKSNNILQQAFVNRIGRPGDYVGRVLGLGIAGGAKLLGKDDAARRFTDAALDQSPTTDPLFGSRVDAPKPFGQGGGKQILQNAGKDVVDIGTLGYGSAVNAALKTAATKVGLGTLGSTFAANAVEGVAYNTATNVLNDRKAMENTGVATAASVLLPAVLNRAFRGKNTAQVVDDLTPTEKLQRYSETQGYEPYMQPDELPVIKLGNKPKESVVKYGTNPKTVELPLSNNKVSNTADSLSIGKQNMDEFLGGTSNKIQEPSIANKPVDNIVDSVAKSEQSFNQTKGIKEVQAAKFDDYISKNDTDTIEKIVKGEVIDNELSPQVAIKRLEEHYLNTNQTDKLLGLKSSVRDVVSKTGQDLSLLDTGLTGSSSPLLNLERAERLLETKMAKRGIDIDSVYKEIDSEVSQALEMAKSGMKPSQIVDSIIDKFTC